MRVTYATRFFARCPVDNEHQDSYEIAVEADETIKVEDLLEVLREYRDKAMLQEEITADINARFAAIVKVTTTGIHSGVKTVCVVP